MLVDERKEKFSLNMMVISKCCLLKSGGTVYVYLAKYVKRMTCKSWGKLLRVILECRCVQVEGTIKVGCCHPWVHQRSGRLMCGDRYQEPRHILSKHREPEQSMIACFHSSHGARKATFILVEQRRSMQRRSSQWRVGRKRCCTRSRSESHSRNQRRRGARQLFAAARTPPPRCSNSRQLIGEALPQSTALVGATPGATGRDRC